ncbi:MAG TPA: PEGA domain-containing protein [Chitinispirillaceae bacterium]|nr:PEGA domain-containing protein [Chitinispirillaceae bacterium]
MNVSNRLLLSLVLYSGMISAAYRDGDFTIPQVSSGFTHCTERSNDIVRNESVDTLERVDTVSAIRPGQLLMRRKCNNGYSFYIGKLDTAVFKKRPTLYAFPIPGWARLSDIIQYRFYREPTDKPGRDEETIYFDQERIFVRNYSMIYYYRNGIWFHLDGDDSLLTGSIAVYSEPPGATLTIDGATTSETTPCTIHRLLPGVHTIELFLDNYHFLSKSVKVVQDSTVKASFQLLSDMDTVYITGDVPYGLLLLPQPPADSLFMIDSHYVSSNRVELHPGRHTISWNGGQLYESIDTAITIKRGIVSYFDVIFRRLYGMLRITPIPADAQICIQNDPCRFGEQIVEIPSDIYRITAHRYGFKSVMKEVLVQPDTIITCEMNLLRSPDNDADGFVDSIDQCPDTYGLYDGCPRQRVKDAVAIKRSEVAEYVKNDPFSFDFSAVGFILRMPTRKAFSDFLSAFSSGKLGGINNYRGFSFINAFQASYKGMIATLELGQWSSGIHYQREDTMKFSTERGNQYSIYYDSLTNVEPVMLIPSTTVSIGLHYSLSMINVSYALGYQWEDIILKGLYNIDKETFESVTFDNDWWFHQLQFETNFRTGEVISPVAYFKFKFPFGRTLRTRWHVMQAGVLLKITPANKKRVLK